MKLLKIHNNKYELHLDTNEVLVMDYINITWGQSYLENYINEHMIQRGKQRDYDELQNIHAEILNLSEEDKVEVKELLKSALAKAKEKKIKNG